VAPPRNPLTPSRLLARAAVLRCPVCASRGVVRHWFGLADRCPRCGLEFERTEGHSIGYIGLNVIVSFTVLFLSMVVGFIATYPELPAGLLVTISVGVALVFPVLFLPFSRTLWIAIDLAMTPLEVGEVDPGWELDQYEG
jgi:uncharacterized protein (DUF983 family)